ncbi:putative histone-lysine N-methyltransferase 1 [Aphis craccivora]|uniref:Putative histone-lysine N-methyltransferase 1 n=1 Tax=Aphis craccivora TaxID=307492 RepID=A0A6G0Z050_APHCR|nr:putative histone-lysine N-methyltransferase 1 [Aphis craccivora]
MIMNAENSSDKWLLYPINIIENSTFNTYEDAVKRERQIFISASECSSTFDGPSFKLYENSTSVSNSYSDQINVNVNHNYKDQRIQQDYDNQIFPVSFIQNSSTTDLLQQILEQGNATYIFLKRLDAYPTKIVNELSSKYSWTGFRNNFRLESLTIMGIIKGVCRENFKTSDIEFETLVNHWFRHGVQSLAQDQLLSKHK